jgi:hypothetical protein
MSFFMQGNKIDNYAIYILLVIYIMHVILMKMNHSYEVALKKSVASFLEVRELNRLANENMAHFHYNLDTRNPSIESLNKINFRQEGEILIFENTYNKNTQGGQFMAKQNNQIRYRMRPINRIKIREERFATPDNRSLMVKARMKQAVIKILTKLQAFHIYEKIKRNKHCVIPVNKFVKDYHKVAKVGDKGEQNIYGGVVSMGKGNSMIMKGFSSEESEEVFDDEIQSTSEEAESQNQSVRSGKLSEANSGGELSANKSVRSGIEVKGNKLS